MGTELAELPASDGALYCPVYRKKNLHPITRWTF
jgi:hypothetical protein